MGSLRASQCVNHGRESGWEPMPTGTRYRYDHQSWAGSNVTAVGEDPATLHVGALGQLTVWRDGQRLDLGPRRQRGVLAVLAVHANTVVSADRLMDQLWAGLPLAIELAAARAPHYDRR